MRGAKAQNTKVITKNHKRGTTHWYLCKAEVLIYKMLFTCVRRLRVHCKESAKNNNKKIIKIIHTSLIPRVVGLKGGGGGGY